MQMNMIIRKLAIKIIKCNVDCLVVIDHRTYLNFLFIWALVSTMCINSIAMPTNDTDCSSHTYAVEPFSQSYGVHITPYAHIMPLVINSLGDRYTYCTHTHIADKIISKNQVCAWFNNVLQRFPAIWYTPIYYCYINC